MSQDIAHVTNLENDQGETNQVSADTSMVSAEVEN